MQGEKVLLEVSCNEVGFLYEENKVLTSQFMLKNAI